MEIKEYLDYGELKGIIDSCLQVQDPLERKFDKDMYVLKHGTDLDIPDSVSSDDWDKYTADGTIEKVYKSIKNVGIIDEMINKAESVENTAMSLGESFNNFLDNINDALDKAMTNMPTDNKGWGDLIDSVKEGLVKNDDRERIADKVVDGGSNSTD